MRTPVPVELITGPPGSGKSTLVRQRAGERDVVIDLDLLAEALSATGQKRRELMPVAWCARDAAMLSIASSSSWPDGGRVWVIACAPSRQERHQAAVPFADVRLTVLEVPPEECLRRIRSDFDAELIYGRDDGTCLSCGELMAHRARSTDWRSIVEQWWAGYRRPMPDEGWTAVEVVG